VIGNAENQPRRGTVSALGYRVYGLGAVALGLVGLAFGDFASVWQPVPAGLPSRTEIAYAVAVLFLLAGLAINWRGTAKAGAALLTVLYIVCVVLLHLPRIVGHPGVFVTWSGAAEQLALVAAGLILLAGTGRARSTGLARIGQTLFGICLLVFGAAHFVYLAETAAMVPANLPPGQRAWAVATGIAHIAAGLAILSGILARPAAVLATVMFAAFSLLVHIPALIADPRSHLLWAANAINLALIGAAWVVADNVGNRRRR
jgi:uncharacterized membrane protein YphA (DoxX/SURF4 family)